MISGTSGANFSVGALVKGFEPIWGRRRSASVRVVSRNPISEASIGDTFAISIDNPLGGLTEKQARALSVALRLGYYASARKVKTSSMAESIGATPSNL